MQEGENILTFSIDSGEYIIDQAELSIFREPEGQDGEFRLTQQQFNDISARGADVMLSLSFSEPRAQGVVSVNGQQLTFRTNEQSFANAITSFIGPGTNTVVIQSSDTPVTLVEVYEE
jgi:hypothetical protein